MVKYKDLYERVYRLEQLLYESKADQDRLMSFLGDEYYDKFNKIKNRISNPDYKDIYKIIKKDPDEVKDFIDSFQSNRSNRQQDKEGAELIYNKNGWKVYHVTTYEAAVMYGKHTKWCIAGNYAGHEDEGRTYFNSYITRRNLDGYYFYIKSDNEKYCVLKTKSGKIDCIYDITDALISVEDLPEDFPSVPGVLSVASERAKYLLYSDNFDDVKQALLSNADVNFINEDGETPLCYACSCDNIEVAELLLHNGADPNVKDNKGNSLISIVCDNSDIELAQLLYDYGADINGRSRDNFNIATSAIARDDDDVLNWVLSKSDFKIDEIVGNETPLISSILEGKFKYVKLLLNAGANLNIRDSAGHSPLHTAVIENYPSIVKLLVAAGANLLAKDTNGNTPLDYAIRDGNKEIINILS